MTHSPAKTPFSYRDRAAERERIAETAIDPSNRAAKLELATRWRALANEGDAQEKIRTAQARPLPPMTESADLRAEAQRLRTFMLTVTDPKVLAGIRTMIEELERRARRLDNADADKS